MHIFTNIVIEIQEAGTMCQDIDRMFKLVSYWTPPVPHLIVSSWMLCDGIMVCAAGECVRAETS